MTSEQPPSRTTAQWNVVDLFAGPGGLDVGAHWLDIPVEGVEWDPNACATRRAAGLGTTQGDVRDYGPLDFPDANVLAGGPPCQTFTVAGTGAGRKALDQVLGLIQRMADGERRFDLEKEGIDDVRTGLILEPLRWALEAHAWRRPYEAIVLEQVPAVLPVWAAVRGVLEGIGYQVDHGIVHTEEFGVPQTRRRAILVARLDRRPSLPRPTHHRYRKGLRPEADADRRIWKTMGEALEETRQGSFTVVSNYGTGGDPKARGRRRSDEPASTVTGKVRRNRLYGRGSATYERFTLLEAGQLQTFPKDFPWSGKDVAQQIGNAIPPRLGAHVLAAALDIPLPAEFLDEKVSAEWVGPSEEPPSPVAPSPVPDRPRTRPSRRSDLPSPATLLDLDSLPAPLGSTAPN